MAFPLRTRPPRSNASSPAPLSSSNWLSRRLAAAVLTLIALFALLFLFTTGSWAGGSRRSSTSSSWTSGHSSSKTIRTESRTPHSYGYTQTTRDDDEEDGPAAVDAYVFSRDQGHWRNGSGSERDWREAEDLRDRIADDPLLWFRRGHDRYMVTDTELLKRFAEAMRPQEILGQKQGELGRQQGELGQLQGELGRQQGKLGVMQASLARRRAALSLRIASQDDASSEALDRERRAIASHEDEIQDLQSEIGDQQSRLGERQSALGEQQSELGRQQSEAAKEVARALDELTREAIRRGLAKPIEP